ncbi:MAG: restriction endonuclease subunit S, partial [Candidatus Aminicenantes bacterium]|nr:restriction endonuclease subunit S [Candidatus Aminicenantes bacterium]
MMGWPPARLGDLAERFISGGTPSTKIDPYWNGDVPWITGADVTDNIVVSGRKWITQEAIENSATHIVPKGAILLVTRTGVGKVAKAGADIAISQDLTGIVLKEGTNADFVAAAIRQKTRDLLDIQQGAIIRGVLRKDVENVEIPFPPLSEQRRIVEILDQTDRLRRLRTEADSKAERILPALFIKMFGDPVTNPMGWPVKALGQV